MDEKELEKKVSDLAYKLSYGYIPYDVKDDRTVTCKSCGNDLNVEEHGDRIWKTVPRTDMRGVKYVTHDCPKCNWGHIGSGDCNISLKLRVVKLCGDSGVKAHTSFGKEGNRYILPDEIYSVVFKNPENPDGTYTIAKMSLEDLTENSMILAANELEEDVMEEKSTDEVVEPTDVQVEEIEEEINEPEVEEVSDNDNEAPEEPVAEEQEEVLEVKQEEDSPAEQEEVLFEEVEGPTEVENFEEDKTTGVENSDISEEKDASDDKSDWTLVEVDASDDEIDSPENDKFGEESLDVTPNVFEEIDESSKPEQPTIDLPNTNSFFEDIDKVESKIEEEVPTPPLFEDIDNVDSKAARKEAKRASRNAAREKRKKPMIGGVNTNHGRTSTGATLDRSTSLESVVVDPLFEKIISKHENSNEGVFDVDLHAPIGTIITTQNEYRVRKRFMESEFNKVLVDIMNIMNVEGKQHTKYNLMISAKTLELAVVDFQGGVRLIFVDTDRDVAAIPIADVINSKVYYSYGKDKTLNAFRKDVETYVVYTDMVGDYKTSRTALAIAKILSYRLGVKVFKTINVTASDIDYYYTSKLLDKDAVFDFDLDNNAGTVRKPSNRGQELALLVKWVPEHVTEEMELSKLSRNVNRLSRGRDIDYGDINITMLGTISYLTNSPDKDGKIHVSVTNYIETLDVIVADGFTTLVGLMMAELVATYPNNTFEVYYELDHQALNSPSVRYAINNEFMTPISNISEFDSINRAITTLSKIRGSRTEYSGIQTPGKNYRTKTYQEPVSRTYIVKKGYRSAERDYERRDSREFNARNIIKTLGDKGVPKGVDVTDPFERTKLMSSKGLMEIIQPQHEFFQIDEELGTKAYELAHELSGGVYSLEEYKRHNESYTVDNGYMNVDRYDEYMRGPGVSRERYTRDRDDRDRGGRDSRRGRSRSRRSSR